MRHGHTLLELSAALLLAGFATSLLVGAVLGTADTLAVVGAREAVAGLIAEARIAALTHGGAEVRVAGPPWRAWSQVGDSAMREVPIEREWGVAVGLPGGGEATLLRYDALGLGLVASETLRFRRGGAERALVISGYGRVRRP